MSYEVPFDLAFPGHTNAAGQATIGPVGPAKANETWVVEQISVSGTAPSATTHATAAIAVNGLFKMGSRTGELDTASQDPPITLQPGETLTCSWAGLAALTSCQLRITGKQRY